MGTRRFKIAPSESCQSCPKCGNKTDFLAHSNQVAEDCCEIWISCRTCGYDPFHDYEHIENCTGYCIEDIWGEINISTISMALDSWNELITFINKEGEKE